MLPSGLSLAKVSSATIAAARIRSTGASRRAMVSNIAAEPTYEGLPPAVNALNAENCIRAVTTLWQVWPHRPVFRRFSITWAM